MKYLIGAVILLATACAESEEDPAVAICNAIGSAGSAITATATRTAAPAITIGATAFDVTLPAQQKSYLKITVAGDTPILFAASVKEVVNGLFLGDQMQTLGEGEALAECADKVPEHFDMDLHEAGDWFVELAPSAVTSLRVVAASGEGHADE